MSGDRRWGTKARIPEGWETIAKVMDELQREVRDQINQPHEGKRKVEAQWPVQQINWQRSRYVYDMYHRYKRIPKAVYDYCVKQKLVDAALIAKWKKPGYERLCSTHAIDPRNFNYGTVSICRVPRYELGPNNPVVEDRHSGCRGCSTGRGGRRNIFGNKFGQYLAAIQISREEREKAGEEVSFETCWATTEDEAKFDNAAVESEDEEDYMNRRKRRRKLQREQQKEAPPPAGAEQQDSASPPPPPPPAEDDDDDDDEVPPPPPAPPAAADAAPKGPGAPDDSDSDDVGPPPPPPPAESS